MVKLKSASVAAMVATLMPSVRGRPPSISGETDEGSSGTKTASFYLQTGVEASSSAGSEFAFTLSPQALSMVGSMIVRAVERAAADAIKYKEGEADGKKAKGKGGKESKERVKLEDVAGARMEGAEEEVKAQVRQWKRAILAEKEREAEELKSNVYDTREKVERLLGRIGKRKDGSGGVGGIGGKVTKRRRDDDQALEELKREQELLFQKTAQRKLQKEQGGAGDGDATHQQRQMNFTVHEG